MNQSQYVDSLANNVRRSARTLRTLSTAQRDQVLHRVAQLLHQETLAILTANLQDLTHALEIGRAHV